MWGHGSQRFSHLMNGLISGKKKQNKSLGPFGIFLPNRTAYPAKFGLRWAELAVLFSRQIQNGKTKWKISSNCVAFSEYTNIILGKLINSESYSTSYLETGILNLSFSSCEKSGLLFMYRLIQTFFNRKQLSMQICFGLYTKD